MLGHTHILFSQYALLFLHWLLLSKKKFFFFHESQEIASALFVCVKELGNVKPKAKERNWRVRVLIATSDSPAVAKLSGGNQSSYNPVQSSKEKTELTVTYLFICT